MIINCFWHGASFSFLEKLTLKSFVNNGYNVKLWCYNDDHSVDCPQQVEICDASEILPYDRLYTYNGNGDCRKGSLGGFSDLFRYYLIYKKGGVYVDMDSTCLKPFDFSADYVIKPHKQCSTVANVLKAPIGSNFLKDCIEETEKHITAENSEWVKPVHIFNEMITRHQLQSYIVPVDYFGHDDPEIMYRTKTERYISGRSVLPRYILHWCKEASYGQWNYRELYDWYKPKPLSVFYNLLQQNNLI